MELTDLGNFCFWMIAQCQVALHCGCNYPPFLKDSMCTIQILRAYIFNVKMQAPDHMEIKVNEIS